jgi:MFS transporter, MHS family, shikimate and dehydroshikimate transport protein
VNPSTINMRRVVASASIGTIVDWYDFFLYGTASALVFPKLFFPSDSSTVGTLLSFAVYATGFVARPLGGALSGHYGDKLGRKTVLLFTLLVMGLATTIIGVLPTYSAIGVVAPVLLVVIRLTQGLAAGGEWGGATLLTLEHSPNRGGFWGSLLSAAVYVGLLLGSLIFVILQHTISSSAMLSWGWRIPFLLSIFIVAVGMYLRSKVTETPEFEKLKATGTRSRVPLWEALRTEPANILAIFLMRIGQNTSFYIVSVFCLSYAKTNLGISSNVTLLALMLGAAVAVCVCPFWGWLADRIGFGKVMVFSLVTSAIAAFPLFLVLGSKASVPIVIFICAVIAIVNASNDAIQPGYFTRMFGANIRYSGMSIGREGGTIIGGGLAPLIATWFLAAVGSWWAVAAWMVFTSLAGLVGVALVRRLRPAGQAPAPTAPGDMPQAIV